MSDDIREQVEKLVRENADRRVQKLQNDLDASVKREVALKATIAKLEDELKKPSPKDHQHAADIKIHSDRARKAITDMDEAQRNVVLLKRKIAELEKSNADKDAAIKVLKADLEQARNEAQIIPPIVDEKAEARLRRSQRPTRFRGSRRGADPEPES